MLRPLLVVAAVAVAALGASLHASQTAPQAVPDDFAITLARTSCFGACPVYSVTIDARGKVTYEGKKFVRVVGTETDHVPVSQAAALAEAVNRIRFFQLNDAYRTVRNADGTETMVTDLPTTIVTVTYDGRSKQVVDYFGAPEPLKELEKQIDETAGTKRWVTLGNPGFRPPVR